MKTNFGKEDTRFFLHGALALALVKLLVALAPNFYTDGEKVILGFLVFIYFRFTHLAKGGEDVQSIFFEAKLRTEKEET